MTALVTVRKTCRLCGSPDLERSLELAAVPIVSPNVGTADGGDGALNRVVAPLDNYLCRACGLIQLVHVVDPALIYRNYLYRTSVSLGLADHFRQLADAVIERLALPKGALVVEFGSNDGTLLGFFSRAGMTVQGVDPAAAIAAEATKKGIPTRADFFGEALGTGLRAERGPARAIIANNAMANIDDLDDVLRGVKALLAPDGAFVFETQYALDVFEKTLLDVIYHEHISCFSVQPVARALARHGLAVFDAERIATKGGSIRFWVGHEGRPHPLSPRVAALIARENEAGLYDLAFHRRFGERVAAIKARLHALIDEVRGTGRPIGAYGISVGCAALIHQFELHDRLDMLFDDAPFKTHLEGPGYRLPVYTADGVYSFDPGLIIVLAWRYAAPIIARHGRFLERDGRFAVPLPELTVHAGAA